MWQASNDWKADDEQVVKAVRVASELGANLVDTAEAYGNGHSEQVLSRVLKELGRDKFVIASKVNGPHLRYEELQKACSISLKRLGVSRIDLYQIHWPDPWEQIPLRETMKALEKLYLEGKIRAIGVSNFAVRDLEEANSFLSKTEIVSNQVRYNLIERDVEKEVIPYCRKEGITIIAYSPLAQGALTGGYSATHTPKDGEFRDTNAVFAPENMARIEKLVTFLQRVAHEHGATVAQIALRHLAMDPIVIPIPGAKNPAQAKENVTSCNLVLSQKESDEIDELCREVKIDYYPEASDLL